MPRLPSSVSLYCIVEGTASLAVGEAQARALTELAAEAAFSWPGAGRRAARSAPSLSCSPTAPGYQLLLCSVLVDMTPSRTLDVDHYCCRPELARSPPSGVIAMPFRAACQRRRHSYMVPDSIVPARRDRHLCHAG